MIRLVASADRTALIAWWLAFALVLGPVVSVPAGATSHEPGVSEFTYTGDGAVGAGGDTLYVWRSAAHAFSVVVDTGTQARDGRVCLATRSGSEGGSTELGCTSIRLPANSSVTVDLGVDQWPANATGDQRITATVRDTSGTGSTIVAEASLRLTVIERSGDVDSDGLANDREVSTGTRLDVADTDGDGIADGQEVDTYGTDPTKSDTDGDGLTDRVETEVTQTDPTMADTDGDGLTDDLEVNEFETNPNNPDTDGDKLADNQEVNSFQTDPIRADTDDDGLSDFAEVETHGTDPRTNDTDGDGLTDGQEVNVYETDPTMADTDGDGLSDDEEVDRYQTNPNNPDTDGDGLEDGPEISVYDTNPNKPDTDGDGMPDGQEVRQGADPTEPTAGAAQPGLAEQLASSRNAVALAVVGGLVALGLAAVLLYRSDRWDSIEARIRAHLPSQAAEPEAEPPVPEPVLTKEDRIMQILGEHGGQIRQRDIVTETGWSKSTVSRTLSRMEQRGEVTKIDIGRGNVIARPGAEPENAKSPFDR